MSPEDSWWGMHRALGQEEAIAYLKDAAKIADPQLRAKTWGRPGDYEYQVSGAEYADDILRMHFQEGSLTIWSPRKFVLWRQPGEFRLWGEDLTKGPFVVAIGEVERLRWEETASGQWGAWSAEIARGETRIQRDGGRGPTFWGCENIVSGDPEFCAYFESRQAVEWQKRRVRAEI